MKKKIIIIGSIVLVLVAAAVVTCFLLFKKKDKEKEPAFFDLYDFTISAPKDTFDVPVYSHAVNRDGDPIDVEGVSFIQKDMAYTFRDAVVSEPDENGNVIWELTYDQKFDIEFMTSTTDTSWLYTFNCVPFSAFDYYTGEIYRVKSISSENATKILNEGLDATNGNKDMAYTDVTWNGKTTRIGILVDHESSKWDDSKVLDTTDSGRHCMATCNSVSTIYISAPKDYDGLMLYINKDGATKEESEKEFENYKKLVELQKQADEAGEKSEELLNREDEKNKVHKLIDSNDEKRKDRKPEYYYIIKVTEFLNK